MWYHRGLLCRLADVLSYHMVGLSDVGTGSSGATIRMYLERYEPDVSKQGEASAASLKGLADAALQISKLQEFTGRDAPTVIT